MRGREKKRHKSTRDASHVIQKQSRAKVAGMRGCTETEKQRCYTGEEKSCSRLGALNKDSSVQFRRQRVEVTGGPVRAKKGRE